MRVSERDYDTKIFYKCRNSDQILKNHQKYVLFSENIHSLLNNNEQKPFLFVKIYIYRSRFCLFLSDFYLHSSFARFILSVH